MPKDVGKDTAEGRIDYMVKQALDSFMAEADERHGIPPDWLREWSANVAERIGERGKALSDEEKVRLMQPRGAVEPTTVRRRAELRQMHKGFVINEADKESGVYTFRCRANYFRMLEEALRAGTTYLPVGGGSEGGRRRAKELNKFAETQAKLRRDKRSPQRARR